MYNQQTGLPNYIKTAIQEYPNKAAEIVLDAYSDKSELDQPEIILSVLTFLPEEFVGALLKDERIAPVVCSRKFIKSIIFQESDALKPSSGDYVYIGDWPIEMFIEYMNTHHQDALDGFLNDLAIEDLVHVENRRYPWLSISNAGATVRMPFSESHEGICIDNTCKATKAMQDWVGSFKNAQRNPFMDMLADTKKDIRFLYDCGIDPGHSGWEEVLKNKSNRFLYGASSLSQIKLYTRRWFGNDVSDITTFPENLKKVLKLPQNNLYAMRLSPDTQDIYMRSIREMTAVQFNHDQLYVTPDGNHLKYQQDQVFHKIAKAHFKSIEIAKISNRGREQLNQRLKIINELVGEASHSSDSRLTPAQFETIMDKVAGMRERIQLALDQVPTITYDDQNLFPAVTEYLDTVILQNSVEELMNVVASVQDEEKGINKISWLQETWKINDDISPFYAVIGESSPRIGMIDAADANRLSLVTQFFIGVVCTVLKSDGVNRDIGQDLEENQQVTAELFRDMKRWIENGEAIESKLYDWICDRYDESKQILTDEKKDKVIDMFKKRYKTISEIREFDEFFHIYGPGIWREKDGHTSMNGQIFIESHEISQYQLNIKNQQLKVFVREVQSQIARSLNFHGAIQCIRRLFGDDDYFDSDTLKQALKSKFPLASMYDIEKTSLLIDKIMSMEQAVVADDHGKQDEQSLDLAKLYAHSDQASDKVSQRILGTYPVLDMLMKRISTENRSALVQKLQAVGKKLENEKYLIKNLNKGLLTDEMKDGLREKRLDINCKYSGMTPLTAAIRSGNIDHVQCLLDIKEQGINLDYESVMKSTEFSYTIVQSKDGREYVKMQTIKPEIIIKELEKMHRIQSVSGSSGKNGIQERFKKLSTEDVLDARKSLIEKIRYAILSEPNRINKKDLMGYTPLIAAILFGDSYAVMHLLWEGVDVNQKDDLGQSPLNLACNIGDRDMISDLIKNGADINEMDDFGRSLLARATLVGDDHFRRWLIDTLIVSGANLDSVDFSGKSVSELLIQSGYRRNIELVLFDCVDKDANGNYKKFSKQSLATMRQYKISHSIDHQTFMINVKTLTNRYGDAGFVHQYHSNLNQTSQYGDTVLMFAITNGNTQAALQLISCPLLDVNHENHLGETPLSLALRFGNTEVLKKLLERKDIIVNRINAYGHTELTQALEVTNQPEGSFKMAIELEGSNSDLDAHDDTMELEDVSICQERENSLMEAFKIYLDDKQSKPDTEIYVGESPSTAMTIACKQGRKSVIQQLCESGCKIGYNQAYELTILEEILRNSPVSLETQNSAIEILKCYADGSDLVCGVSNPKNRKSRLDVLQNQIHESSNNVQDIVQDASSPEDEAPIKRRRTSGDDQRSSK